MFLRLRSLRPPAATYVLIVTMFAACSSQPTHLSSNVAPGQPILSFPNREDRSGTTVISSSEGTQQAGVDGAALTVSTVDISKSTAQLTLDTHGNMGLAGTYHSLSSRQAKTAVHRFRGDAVDLLDRTTIVTFRYRGEPLDSEPHLGIIAEDAPVPLTDRRHRSFDLNNSISLTIAAEKQLSSEVRSLQAQVARLNAALRSAKR